MNNEDAVRLLLYRAGLIEANTPSHEFPERDARAAREFAQEIGGHPLALDQAGTYINEKQITPEEYLQLYRQHGEQLRRGKVDSRTFEDTAITTTFSLAFEALEERDQGAADLLRFCALLAPDPIPEEMLLNDIAVSDSSMATFRGMLFVFVRRSAPPHSYRLSFATASMRRSKCIVWFRRLDATV